MYTGEMDIVGVDNSRITKSRKIKNIKMFSSDYLYWCIVDDKTVLTAVSVDKLKENILLLERYN
jgi:hypothetical protein